jgi:hypothetical protein
MAKINNSIGIKKIMGKKREKCRINWQIAGGGKIFLERYGGITWLLVLMYLSHHLLEHFFELFFFYAGNIISRSD